MDHFFIQPRPGVLFMFKTIILPIVLQLSHFPADFFTLRRRRARLPEALAVSAGVTPLASA